jgi:hypothetical protein
LLKNIARQEESSQLTNKEKLLEVGPRPIDKSKKMKIKNFKASLL